MPPKERKYSARNYTFNASSFQKSTGDYLKKGIKENEAKVLFATNNYYGRILGSTSTFTILQAKKNYEHFIPDVGPYYSDNDKFIRYNHIEDVEEAFRLEGKNIAVIILESVQGGTGIYVLGNGYLHKVKALREKYNILYIADEIQVGAGRIGKLLSYEQDGITPYVLVVDKSIGGEICPTSLVLSSEEIINSILPKFHGGYLFW